jgi:hypothetical protein
MTRSGIKWDRPSGDYALPPELADSLARDLLLGLEGGHGRCFDCEQTAPNPHLRTCEVAPMVGRTGKAPSFLDLRGEQADRVARRWRRRKNLTQEPPLA